MKTRNMRVRQFWADGEYAKLSDVGGGLFLSGDYFTRQDLEDLGIAGVVSVARECPDAHLEYADKIRKAHFGFRDHVIMDHGMVEAAVSTVRAFLRHGNVLVHCGVGISRSPTIIALYRMAMGEAKNYEEAIARLQKDRPCVQPNRVVDDGVFNMIKNLRRKWAGE